MNTPYHILKPLSHTAVLLPGICDDGRDLLIDMGHNESDLSAALALHGRTIADIAHLLITHDHGDHFDPKAAHCFLGTDTRIHIPEYGYQRLMNHPVFDPVRADFIELDADGRINRLPNIGTADFGGVEIHWKNSWHLDTVNLSFRIRDLLISGDTSHDRLFDDPASPLFTAGADGPVRTAILQTNMLDADDAQARGVSADDIQRWAECTGTGAALIQKMRDPKWAAFFVELETIVPHHLRIDPLERLADALRAALLKTGKEQGFTFAISFGEQNA